MTAFMGMIGTGDWADNQVPESWAQYIMHEYPNGSAPMFAMQGMFKEEQVDSHTFHWWTKTTPVQAGAVTSVYIDSGLVTEYVYASHQSANGIAGQVVYAKVAEALAKEFRKGHNVRLRDSDQITADVYGRVVDVLYDGSNSYVAVKLREADDNHTSSSTYNLSTVDRILITSSSFSDASAAPSSITYLATEYSNYIQVFRNTMELGLIAKATSLRTGDAYLEEKRQCGELHSIEMEKSGFWGKKFTGTDDNGQPIYETQGLIDFVTTNASSNVVDFRNATDAAYSGKTWLQAGKKFLNTYIMQLARYLTGGECIAFCGDAALLAINDLAEAYGDISLTTKQKDYGIEVTEWHIPGMRVNLKTHPLFSHETTHQNMMVLLHPRNVKFAPLVGGGENFHTKYQMDLQVPGVLGKHEGYLTVGGWKFYFPNQFMVMYGVGQDNVN